MRKERGITLITLIVTIIILLILATVSINLIWNDNGILEKAKNAVEEQNKATVEEKVKLILGEYAIESAIGTETIEEYLNEQKKKGEIEEVTNNEDGTLTVEIDGYRVTIKEEDLSIVSIEKAGGVKPKFDIKSTKTDGTELTGDETEKAITINITNIIEVGDNYTIEVKDKDGNTIIKETNVISGITGQASYIINNSGNYTITVTATKDGITKSTTRTETIKVAMAKIEETVAFSRANGVIDIVWLDMNNNVIRNPISPADYLGGLTAIKYNVKTEETVSNPKNDNSWYNYVAQTGVEDGKTSNWANARSSDSNAYFVWIPRYAYKITYFDTPENANAYRENKNSKMGIIGYSNIEGIVDVQSGIEKLVKDSKPTNVIGTVKTGEYLDYIPHPAFEFDGGKAGMWVGKFENSGSKSKITIIPNKNSLKKIKVGEMFTASQGLKNTYSLMGDSHMMKNTEWGAVSYLAESKYGRNGAEIAMNNSNEITGAGDYALNVLQSTTGNIYGIYDMNGGSWEYVAGVLDSKLKNDVNGSYYDFTAINDKYYNVYSSYNESKKIKGDGVYETSIVGFSSISWHQDAAIFVDSDFPVFIRGGMNGYGDAGSFAFNNNTGAAKSNYTFRVVYVPLVY